MPEQTKKYAFNQTRRAFLATDVSAASTHLARAKGLMFRRPASFCFGRGLWIVPCHGVHTFGMRFAIDVIYLDENADIVHLEENVRPWRLTPVLLRAPSVLDLPARPVWASATETGDP